jgi:hypothetical protein
VVFATVSGVYCNYLMTSLSTNTTKLREKKRRTAERSGERCGFCLICWALVAVVRIAEATQQDPARYTQLPSSMLLFGSGGDRCGSNRDSTTTIVDGNISNGGGSNELAGIEGRDAEVCIRRGVNAPYVDCGHGIRGIRRVRSSYLWCSGGRQHSGDGCPSLPE